MQLSKAGTVVLYPAERVVFHEICSDARPSTYGLGFKLQACFVVHGRFLKEKSGKLQSMQYSGVRSEGFTPLFDCKDTLEVSS
jgi:hypothetical protein